MIAVIFEMEPADVDAYFRIARELRPLLDTIEGFVSIERFQSLSDERRILSLSFWRDEAAVAQWRRMEAHRAAQAAGREGVFRGYRLRVARVLRDYGMHELSRRPPTPARGMQLVKWRERAGAGRPRFSSASPPATAGCAPLPASVCLP